MFKKIMNKKLLKNQKGLTLIELLAVIVILAIVAAIAIPAIGNIINNSRDKAILSEASNILAGAKIANVDQKCTVSGTTITCDKAQLQEFVEGVALDTGDKAVLTVNTSSKEWTITYLGLKDVKQDKYKEGISADNSISETSLNKNLKK
ncbi:prepilin-type N-terminal cleavage/methylation domain-containing protein [Lysinibacillus sp. NPDC093692]|uniref:prepilin-type N-terminal cleavage/methylation domain-containing protein n=1 Tax=Lysinibacillus sp. NPDC093692 TaxID=3390578 RepID=UPI003CFECD22